MSVIEKILFGGFFMIYIYGISILIFKYDSKGGIMPRCAGQGFYVYYDNEDKMCKCYRGYERVEGKKGCFRN